MKGTNVNLACPSFCQKVDCQAYYLLHYN